MSNVGIAQSGDAHSEFMTGSAELIETIGKNHLSFAPNGDWAVWSWDAATAQYNRVDRGRGALSRAYKVALVD